MHLLPDNRRKVRVRFPRRRGDAPSDHADAVRDAKFPPQARGCTSDEPEWDRNR